MKYGKRALLPVSKLWNLRSAGCTSAVSARDVRSAPRSLTFMVPMIRSLLFIMVRQPHARASRGRIAFVVGVFGLAVFLGLVPIDATAMDMHWPPIFHVRLACAVNGPSIEAVGLTEHRLCEEARSAIQELADGKIDHDIALTDGWAHFVTPHKKRALEECAKKLGSIGFCDADSYFLSYRGELVPITEISGDSVRDVDPEGLTVVVTGSGARPINLSVTVIEPSSSSSVPPHQIDLPPVEVDRIGSLHMKLKLALARYFIPERLNHILGNVVRRRAAEAEAMCRGNALFVGAVAGDKLCSRGFALCPRSEERARKQGARGNAGPSRVSSIREAVR
jgi:hypothetical protein